MRGNRGIREIGGIKEIGEIRDGKAMGERRKEKDDITHTVRVNVRVACPCNEKEILPP
jgi:hypothetical protein